MRRYILLSIEDEKFAPREGFIVPEEATIVERVMGSVSFCFSAKEAGGIEVKPLPGTKTFYFNIEEVEEDKLN
jgi:hypothetical protein